MPDRFTVLNDLMDAPEEHSLGEYLTVRAFRHGHRLHMRPREDWSASEMAPLDDALARRREERSTQYPTAALREEMIRLVQAFVASSFVQQLTSVQREVSQVRHDLDEFRRVIVPMKEADERFEKELAALEAGLPKDSEVGEQGEFNFKALLDDLE